MKLPSTFLAIVILANLAGITACTGKKPESGEGSPAPAPAAPPAVEASTVHRAKLTLEGGPFSPPRNLELSLEAPLSELEMLGDGLRLKVMDPAKKGNLQAHGWGLWIFADGKIEEEAVLNCRTGTQVVLDGVVYAPAAKPKSSPAPTFHPLQATLQITRLEPERGIFEAELSANLLAPDGKTQIKLTGELKLPWPAGHRPGTIPGNQP